MPDRYRLTLHHLKEFEALPCSGRMEMARNAAEVGDAMPVVRSMLSTGPTLVHLPWGIEVNGRTVYNTAERQEILRERLLSGRCLIPASGWYEFFRNTERSLEPMLIHGEEGTGFCFAGLWTARIQPKWNKLREAFTILTVPAGASTLWLNQRMPLIVPCDYSERWLATSLDFAQIATLLTELTSVTRRMKLSIHPVAPLLRHIVASDDFGKPLAWWQPIHQQALAILSRRQFLCSAELAAELAICNDESWNLLKGLWTHRIADYRPNPALDDLLMWAIPVQDEEEARVESGQKAKAGIRTPERQDRTF